MDRQTVRCFLSITQIFPNPHRGSCPFSASHEFPQQKSRLVDELFAAIHTVIASFTSFSCMRFLVADGCAGAATARLCENMLTHHLAALKTKAHWCVGTCDWSWSNDLPAVLSSYRLSSITSEVGTAVSTQPLVFYPHSHLVVVKPSLGHDLGCQDLYPLRQPVQFGPAELQIPGQFVKSEPSVQLSSSPLPRESINQTKRMRTKADEYRRRRTNADECR